MTFCGGGVHIPASGPVTMVLSDRQEAHVSIATKPAISATHHTWLADALAVTIARCHGKGSQAVMVTIAGCNLHTSCIYCAEVSIWEFLTTIILFGTPSS